MREIVGYACDASSYCPTCYRGAWGSADAPCTPILDAPEIALVCDGCGAPIGERDEMEITTTPAMVPVTDERRVVPGVRWRATIEGGTIIHGLSIPAEGDGRDCWITVETPGVTVYTLPEWVVWHLASLV